MRISATSFNMFWADREQWWLRYVAKQKGGQTLPMAIGSAFDSLIKNHILVHVMGAQEVYGFDKIDESIRPAAIRCGHVLMDTYTRSGALAGLLAELSRASMIRMEFEVEATVETATRNVVIMGYPDLWYITKAGRRVILDWKCNNYAAARVSPPPGYLCDFPGGKIHKLAMPMLVDDVLINLAGMDGLSDSERVQLIMYGWLMGETPGSDYVVGIERLIGQDRVARYRCKAALALQHDIVARLAVMAEAIETGTVISRERQEVLEAGLAQQSQLPSWL